jgi:hypothetical protein
MLTQYFLHMKFVNRPGKRNSLMGKTSNMENVKIRFTLWIHFLILIASNYFNVFRLQKITNVCYHGNFGTEVLQHRHLLFNPSHNGPPKKYKSKSSVVGTHTLPSFISLSHYTVFNTHSLTAQCHLLQQNFRNYTGRSNLAAIPLHFTLVEPETKQLIGHVQKMTCSATG